MWHEILKGLCVVFGSCCCARAAAGAFQSQPCPLLGHCRVTFVICWTKIDQNATVLLALRHAWVMKSWCFLVFLHDSKYMFFTFCSWHSPITRCFRLQYVVSSFACAFSQAVSSIFFRIPWDETFTRTLMSWSVLKSVFWHTINGHSSSSMTQSFTEIAVTFWMDLAKLPSWWARHIHWAGVVSEGIVGILVSETVCQPKNRKATEPLGENLDRNHWFGLRYKQWWGSGGSWFLSSVPLDSWTDWDVVRKTCILDESIVQV